VSVAPTADGAESWLTRVRAKTILGRVALAHSHTTAATAGQPDEPAQNRARAPRVANATLRGLVAGGIAGLVGLFLPSVFLGLGGSGPALGLVVGMTVGVLVGALADRGDGWFAAALTAGVALPLLAVVGLVAATPMEERARPLDFFLSEFAWLPLPFILAGCACGTWLFVRLEAADWPQRRIAAGAWSAATFLLYGALSFGLAGAVVNWGQHDIAISIYPAPYLFIAYNMLAVFALSISNARHARAIGVPAWSWGRMVAVAAAGLLATASLALALVTWSASRSYMAEYYGPERGFFYLELPESYPQWSGLPLPWSASPDTAWGDDAIDERHRNADLAYFTLAGFVVLMAGVGARAGLTRSMDRRPPR
jgi:hypothetical protein